MRGRGVRGVTVSCPVTILFLIVLKMVFALLPAYHTDTHARAHAHSRTQCNYSINKKHEAVKEERVREKKNKRIGSKGRGVGKSGDANAKAG